MIEKYKNLNYPLNIWSTVFGREVTFVELPEDWERTFIFILGRLKSKQRAALNCYFKDGLSFEEIGLLNGMSEKQSMMMIEKAVNILQSPSRMIFLQYGLEKGTLIRTQEKAQRRIDYRSESATQVCLASPISALDLSPRIYNNLRKFHINTIEELVSYTEKDLLEIRDMGSRSLNDIKAQLAKHGYCLRGH